MTAAPVASAGEAPSSQEIGAPALLVVGWAFLLPIVFAPQVFAWFFTPKAALALVALGPGLVVAVRLGCARDRAALGALAFLLVAALATALADVPTLALLGSYLWGNGLLFVALLVGAWALGRTLAPAGRDLLGIALVGAALVNAGIAWLQLDRSRADWAQPPRTGCRACPIVHSEVWSSAPPPASTGRASGGVARSPCCSPGRCSSPEAGRAVPGWPGSVARNGALTKRRAARGRGSRAKFVGSIALPLRQAGTDRIGGDVAVGLGPRVRAARRGRGPRGATAARLRTRPLRRHGAAHCLTVAVRAATFYADAHNMIVETVTTTGLLGLAARRGWCSRCGDVRRCCCSPAWSRVDAAQPEWLAPTARLLASERGTAGPEGRSRPWCGHRRGAAGCVRRCSCSGAT
jgi:hypothetical protein